MIYENKLVSSSGSEPIDSTYLKNYIRVDFSTDDSVITALITSARQLVEQYIEQALISKVFKCYYHEFEDWDEDNGYYFLPVPISPATVTAVKTVADDGTETAITDYSVTGLDEKTVRVTRTYSLTSAGTVGYVVEYTAENTSIDEAIKDAIAKTAGELYEHRQITGVDVSISMLPMDVKVILNNYRKTFI